MRRTGLAAALAVAVGIAAAVAIAKPAATPMCVGARATLVGTPKGDVLRGTPRADVIAALGGNDRVRGFAGNDRICGGAGRDTLEGGPGNDRLDGGSGRDRLDGGAGTNSCRGGELNKRCAAGSRDSVSPEFKSASIQGPTLTMTYDEQLASAPLSGTFFRVTVNAVVQQFAGVGVSGTSVIITLAFPAPGGAFVSVAYRPASSGGIRDAAGNAAPGLEPTPVTNTSAIPPAVGPGFSPSLAKPAFADQRSTSQPWVGEWGPKSDPYWLPGTGRLRGLIVPVDFSDAPATRAVDFYRNMFEPVAEGYYREISYGRLVLDLTTLSRWVRMGRPAASYGLQNCCPQSALRAFLEELTGLIDGEVDFSQIDAIFAVGPESSGQHLSILLYRAWPGEGVVRDGRELRSGVVGNGNFDSRERPPLLPHHLITHEFGHLLGLPDLYNAQVRDGGAGQFAWAGTWDIMSDNRASGHMFAWHKWLLGWLDPAQLTGLTSPGSVEETITPLETPGGKKAVVVPTSASTAYVVEVRQPVGEDAQLCDRGVLLWFVDSSQRNAQSNAVVQAAKRSSSVQCGAIYDAPFDLGPGEVPTFEDAVFRLELLEAKPDGSYRVRVSRK